MWSAGPRESERQLAGAADEEPRPPAERSGVDRQRDRGALVQLTLNLLLAAFREAYDAPPGRTTIARALASFVRTILSGDTPFDRFRAGDGSALSPEALNGFRLFTGRANCATCHVGPTFSDQHFHNTGVAIRHGAVADSGRFLVTRRAEDLGAFKTPTLRDVERSAPYMHDGSIPTLGGVIDFYAMGGRPNPHLDREIRPLKLSAEEKDALIAFLRSLTGTVKAGNGSHGTRQPM